VKLAARAITARAAASSQDRSFLIRATPRLCRWISAPCAAAWASQGIQAAKASAMPNMPPPKTMRAGASASIPAPLAKQPARPGTQRIVQSGSAEKAKASDAGKARIASISRARSPS
jgi:hypothetical protein